MTGIWTPDTVEGSSLDVQAFTQTHVITGVVDQIDATVGARQLLWTVINILGANGLTFNPQTYLDGHPNLILRRIRAVGISDSSARVALIFQSPDYGTPSAYYIKKGGLISTIETDLLPGTRVPLRMKDTTIAATVGAPAFTIPGKNVLFKYLRPIDSIQISVLNYGTPPPSKGFKGKVNDAQWPPDSLDPSVTIVGFTTGVPQGYPPGYWMVSKWDTTIAKWQGYYEINGEAITQNDEDWSQSAILTDPRTGQKIQLNDPVGTPAAAMALPYSFGIIFNQDGYMRVGLHKTASFKSIFGF